MAASGDSKPEPRGKDSGSLLKTPDDVEFMDPLLTGLEHSDEDEGTESLKADPSTPSETRSPSHTSSSLSNLQSDGGNDDTDTRDLFVKVDNAEKQTSTLEAYITFRVSTQTTRAEFGSSEYSVRRRFSDFVWLRQQLEQCYPTHLVPPLPQKHTLTRLDHFSLDFVRMRQKALQKFLGRLADHPVLSFDKNLYVFLTTDTPTFQSHRKQGKGILTQMTDSIHNLGASYMMRNRPVEFSVMHEFVSVFGEKMAAMDRISARVLKEQSDYHSELCGWGPCYVSWADAEDQMRAPLLSLASTVDQCSHHLKHLVDETDDNLTQPLKEYTLYTECIKAVLRRRDAIQMEYDKVVDELNRRKDEREQVKISDQTYSFGSFLGKDPQEVKVQKQEKVAQQVANLTKQKELLSDKTEVADANLKADMERWHKTKRQDVKQILISMADQQIQYYEQCLSLWQDAIRGIQKKAEDSTPMAADTDTDIVDALYSSRTASSRASTTADTTCTTTTTTTAGIGDNTLNTTGDDSVSAPSVTDVVTSAVESNNASSTSAPVP